MASVLAVPHASGGRDAFEAYLQRVIGWAGLTDVPTCRVAVASATAAVLLENSLYPFRPELQKAIHTLGITEYSIEDIVSLTDRLMEGALEADLGVVEVLYCDVETDPELCEISKGARFVADAERVLCLVGVSSLCDLACCIVCVEACEAASVMVRFRLEDIEAAEPARNALGQMPRQLEVECRVARTIEHVYAHVDEVEVWSSIESDEDLATALRFAASRRAMLLNEDEPARFHVHRGLLPTIQRYGFIHVRSKAKRLICIRSTNRVPDVSSPST